MVKCVDYNIRLVDLFMPTFSEFKSMCEPRNKTRLIVGILIKLFIYGIFFVMLYKNQWIEYDSKSIWKHWAYMSFITILCLFIVSLIIALSQKPYFDKNTVEQQTTYKGTDIKVPEVQIFETGDALLTRPFISAERQWT